LAAAAKKKEVIFFLFYLQEDTLNARTFKEEKTNILREVS